MNRAEVTQWLEGARQYVRLTAGGQTTVVRLLEELQIGLAEGRPVLYSPLTASGKYKSENLASRLSRVNRVLQTFGPPGGRWILTKPREGDYFVLESVPAPIIIRNDDAYGAIRQDLDRLGSIKTALVIQHAGQSCLPLISALLERKVDVDLYVQAPAGTVTTGQAGKVKYVVEDLPSYFWSMKTKPTGHLRVFQYDAPASIRVVRLSLDREGKTGTLAIGWYTYHRVSNRTRPEAIWIQGHTNPMVVVESGSGEYAVLNDFVDRVLADMSRHAQKALEMPPFGPEESPGTADGRRAALPPRPTQAQSQLSRRRANRRAPGH